MRRLGLLAMFVLIVIAFVQEAWTDWEKGKTKQAAGSAAGAVVIAVVAALWARSMMRRG